MIGKYKVYGESQTSFNISSTISNKCLRPLTSNSSEVTEVIQVIEIEDDNDRDSTSFLGSTSRSTQDSIQIKMDSSFNSNSNSNSNGSNLNGISNNNGFRNLEGRPTNDKTRRMICLIHYKSLFCFVCFVFV